jgi:hypothetical protein
MQIQLKTPYIIILSFLLCIAFFIAVFTLPHWDPRFSSVSDSAKDYADLKNQFYIKRFLDYFPPTCSDIKYLVYPYLQDVYATFSISEEDFLNWAKDKKWPLLKIEGEFNIPPWDKIDIFHVFKPTRGYHFESDLRQAPRLIIAYNSDTKKVAFSLIFRKRGG